MLSITIKGLQRTTSGFYLYLQIFPTVVIPLIPQPLLENLDMLLRVSSTPVTLHYDTIFNMGDFYLSTLVFHNSIFEKNPITPVAYFVYSRRYQHDHIKFMQILRQSLPLLDAKKILIVTYCEFDFSDIFPQCLNAYCWNHLECDLHFYLKNSANCKPSEISYCAITFKELIIEESEEEFNKAWNNIKASFTNQTVLKYFEQILIPAFKEHSSVWKLRKMGIPDPENRLTNNPSESMNAILRSLQQWKQVPLDVICVSLFHLSCYYECKIIRAHHLCSTWNLKALFYLQRDASLMPFLPKTINPKEIVNRAR